MIKMMILHQPLIKIVNLYFQKFSFQRNISLSVWLKWSSLLAWLWVGDSSRLTCVFSSLLRYVPAEQSSRTPWPYRGQRESHWQKCIEGEGWGSGKSHLKAWNLKWISPFLGNKKGHGKRYNTGWKQPLLETCHIYAFYSGEGCLFPLMRAYSVKKLSKFNWKAVVVYQYVIFYKINDIISLLMSWYFKEFQYFESEMLPWKDEAIDNCSGRT